MPLHERGRLFRTRLDNLACDCVDQPHTFLFAVTNQPLRNFAVSPIARHHTCCLSQMACELLAKPLRSLVKPPCVACVALELTTRQLSLECPIL